MLRRVHCDLAGTLLAYIGTDFRATRSEMFDAAYMQGLFDYGYQHARDGTLWHTAPPGERER